MHESEIKTLPPDHTPAMCVEYGCSPVSERKEWGIDWGFHFDDAGYCLGCGGCGEDDCCGPCDCRFDK